MDASSTAAPATVMLSRIAVAVALVCACSGRAVDGGNSVPIDAASSGGRGGGGGTGAGGRVSGVGGGGNSSGVAGSGARMDGGVDQTGGAGGAGPFDTLAAVNACFAAAASASSCRAQGESAGKGEVIMTFSPSGTVTSLSILASWIGPLTAECVRNIFSKVTVPPFSGDPVTVQKSFTVT